MRLFSGFKSNNRRVEPRAFLLAICCLMICVCMPSQLASAQESKPEQLREYLKQIRNAGSMESDTADQKGFASDPNMLEQDAPPKPNDDSDETDSEPETGDPDSIDSSEKKSDVQKDARWDGGSDKDESDLLPEPIVEPPVRLNTLELSDVLASVFQSYPVIIQARQQSQLALGQLTEAWGTFDTKLNLSTLNEPTGFYENYRHSIGASQRNWGGNTVYGGYRIGRGSFQPWYEERETDEGGELKVGYQQSLLQGREIDPARLAVYQATLDQKAVEPGVRLKLLSVSQDASLQYWDWVEAGLVLQAQQSLVDLAEKRGKQYEAGVDAGKFPEIDLILNKQLIAERRAKLIESTQKFQASAFKLALYLRDQQGNPLVPDADLLPVALPAVQDLPEPDLERELASAVARRPESQLLEIERKRLQNKYSLAQNQLQPVLDFIGEGSQDLGEDASSSDDKDQFVLILGLQGELPIQRRKARGKLMAIHAKLAQLSQKQRLMQNKIQADLSIGFNELQRDVEVVEQAYESLLAARETLERYRFAFDRGKIDLIYLNLLEVKANETEIKYLNATKQWHVALARLRASQAIDQRVQQAQ